MASDLAFVRLAASRRRFLLSWRLGALYWVVSIAIQVAVDTDFGPVPAILAVAALLGFWWFNRTTALWIERDGNGITVRTRRWAKWEDLSTGRLRSDGTVTHQFSPDETIIYEPDPIAWWRADRTLIIGSQRFAVHPESRKLAQAVADTHQWVAVQAQA